MLELSFEIYILHLKNEYHLYGKIFATYYRECKARKNLYSLEEIIIIVVGYREVE